MKTGASAMNRTILAAFSILGLAAAAPAPKPSMVPVLDWDLLSRTIDHETDGVWRPVYPAEVSALNGARVRLSGHVLGANQGSSLEIVLSAHAGGCTCALCATRASALVALAELPVQSAITAPVVTVEGRLDLVQDGDSPLYYVLHDARLVTDADRAPAA